MSFGFRLTWHLKILSVSPLCSSNQPVISLIYLYWDVAMLRTGVCCSTLAWTLWTDDFHIHSWKYFRAASDEEMCPIVCVFSFYSPTSWQHSFFVRHFSSSAVQHRAAWGRRRQTTAAEPCLHWPVSWRGTMVERRAVPQEPQTPPTGSLSGTASLPKVTAPSSIPLSDFS